MGCKLKVDGETQLVVSPEEAWQLQS